MFYGEIKIGGWYYTVNGTFAECLAKNKDLGLVKLSFEVVNGMKTDVDGWWKPENIVARVPNNSLRRR